MENNFVAIMSKKTNEELVQITTIDALKYQSVAVEAAKKELESRNIDLIKFQQIKEEIEKEQSQFEEVNVNTASSLIRLVNFIIDFITVFILSALLAAIVNLFVVFNGALTNAIFRNLMLIISLVLYYSILESKFQKTLGKLITKTRVIRTDGNVPSQNDIIYRSLSRLIPFDNVSYLFTRNGFHDRLSQTTVVKDIRQN